MLTEPRPWRVEHLGTLSYREAWVRQLAEVDRRKAGVGDDVLLTVEHPHVITLGRRRESASNVLTPGDVEVVEIERGGDVTYHGPGQLVAYPILALVEGERDLHGFLRGMEDAVIATLDEFGLASDREPGKTGVWLSARAGGRKKICSMGIACRRWVTFHGLALNVSTDLSYFHRINPCGFQAEVMTSLVEELGVGVAMDDVRAALARQLGVALRRVPTR